MSLQFILGNSGGGKTTWLYSKIISEAMAHPEKRYLVIVPEQFTMSTQKALVKMHPRHSILNIDVLSFGRLSYRVLEELGGGDGIILEDTGKNFLLRKIAEEKKPELKILKGNLRKMGYIDEIKSFLSELMQYRIAPDDLTGMAELARGEALKLKLKDIQLIYDAFLKEIGKSYITAEGRMELVISKVKDSGWLDGATLVFDGFTGFTPIQNELLEELIKVTEKVYITATMEPTDHPFDEGEMQELFFMSHKFLKTTKEIAEKNQIKIEPEIIWCTEGRKEQKKTAPQLYHLEQNLFRPLAKSYQIGANATVDHYATTGEGAGIQNESTNREISILRLKDPKQEAEYAARKIYLMVKNEGYRYHDFAVVSGDAEGFAPYLRQAFEKYGIPVFMDAVSKVIYHPFCECVQQIVELVRTNVSQQSVIAFLRARFYGLSAEQVDLLENYFLACGITRKSRWEKEWTRNPLGFTDEKLAELNDFRKHFLTDYSELEAGFANGNIREETLAVYHLIEKMDCGRKLKEDAALLAERGEYARAKETEQIYRILIRTLEKLADLLGEETADPTEYKELLSAGLSGADIAVIPHGSDCVTIGDIERTRLNQVKVMFFVGVNDGIIPGGNGSGGILSELERSELLDHKVKIAYGARERALMQRFYLYLNMTKPTERLYLTFSGANAKGETLRPSFLIGTMEKLFPGSLQTETEDTADPAETISLPETPQAGFERFAGELAVLTGDEDEIDPKQWLLLFLWYRKNEEFATKAKRVFDAAFYTRFEENIGAELAGKLYGKVLRNSVTRLENFNSCAFSHFLKYGLHLEEREVYEVNAADLGTVLHAAMDHYTELVLESKLPFGDVPEETCRSFCDHAISKALAESEDKAFSDKERSKFLTERLKKIFERTVTAVTRQMKAGTFQVAEHEQKFDAHYELEDGIRMNLTGKIDRMDLAEDEENVSVRIVDYKSSDRSLDLKEFYNGVSLQLLLYLNFAMKKIQGQYPEKKAVPAGVLYYGMKNPMVKAEDFLSEDVAEEKQAQELSMNGYVNQSTEEIRKMDNTGKPESEVIPVKFKGDQPTGNYMLSTEEFEDLMAFVQKKIISSGEEMEQGRVAIDPYRNGSKDSCAYCAFQSVCGKNSKLPGETERLFDRMKKEEILEKIHLEVHPEDAMAVTEDAKQENIMQENAGKEDKIYE